LSSCFELAVTIGSNWSCTLFEQLELATDSWQCSNYTTESRHLTFHLLQGRKYNRNECLEPRISAVRSNGRQPTVLNTSGLIYNAEEKASKVEATEVDQGPD
jgi:hypothetical protein